MEIIAAIGSDTRYNLHSHTQFCDGHASMEQMVEGAISAGLRHYGFSPHSPLPIESPCNMASADVEAYKKESERLRKLYDSQISLYTAMEVDYLGPQWGPHSREVKDYGLDYVIGSVHFVPNQAGEYIDTDGPSERFKEYVRTAFRGDLHYVVNKFFDQSEAMLEAGGLDIIGHFDKIALNASSIEPDIEQQPWFGKRIDSLIECIRSHGTTVEINTKALTRRGRFFPHERLWNKLLAAHIPLLINSDAHDPALTDAGRNEALRKLSYYRNDDKA